MPNPHAISARPRPYHPLQGVPSSDAQDTGISFLTDSLTGILKKDYNEKDIRAERIAEKYENID